MNVECYFLGGGGLEGLGGGGFPGRCRAGSGDRLDVLSEGCGLAVERLGLLVEIWLLGREGRGGPGLGGGGRGNGGEGETVPLSDDDDGTFEGR